MTIPAEDIFEAAWEDLNDDGTRWPAETLLKHLNNGQKVLCVLKPTANVVTAAVALAAGCRQDLPAGALGLLRVGPNVTGAGAVGATPATTTPGTLDGILPDWQSRPAAKVVKQVAYDETEPKAFYTYPPQPGSTDQQLTLTYPSLPAAIATVDDDLTVPDEFAPALTDYVISRAFAKDSEVAEAATRSQAALANFAAKLGLTLGAVRRAIRQQEEGQ